MFDFRRALGACVAIGMLAGCGGSQSQSAPPVPTQDGSYPNVRIDKKPAMQWEFTTHKIPEVKVATVVAYCPPNYIVTGGGWSQDAAHRGHMYVWEEHPGTRFFDRWSVTLYNDTTTTATVRVYAGCLPRS
jgi:hypothetical protein